MVYLCAPLTDLDFVAMPYRVLHNRILYCIYDWMTAEFVLHAARVKHRNLDFSNRPQSLPKNIRN